MYTSSMLTALLYALPLIGSAVGLPGHAAAPAPAKVPPRRWALTIARPTRLSTTADDLPAWAYTSLVPLDKDITTTANDAIANLFTYRDANFNFRSISPWQVANAYTAVTSYDLYTGRRHQQQVTQGLRYLIERRVDNSFNDDSLWWALACIDAYQAYGGDDFAAHGKRLWQRVKDTSLVVQTGIAPNMGGIQRTAVLSDQCSLEYGVYWTTKRAEIYLNSITTGLMAQTSARLSETTGSNQDLTDVAQGTLEFLRSHTIDAGQLLVNQDGVEGDDCSVTPGAFTYNTGVYIAALVSLWRKSGDNAFLGEAEEVAIAAMETTLWTDGNGLLNDYRGKVRNSDGVGFRSILIRALVRLYKSTSNQSVRTEIRGFVNSNFNLMYTNARSGDDYDTDWYAPFSLRTVWGQFVAIDLVGAAAIVNTQ